MKAFSKLSIIYCIVAFVAVLVCAQSSFAQTPGLIYKPATNGGNKVLDPDGNGYVSITTAGFPGQNMDEGSAYSEIPYKPFPVFMNEPLSDLATGNKGGHTDFAPKVYDGNGNPIGSPLAMHFDGTNFLFRVRLGGQSTASKGYSILIDTNNNVSGTGINPGFEFEVVLATNFDVRIYDHRTNTTGGDIIFNGSVDQYSQKAIASSLGGGDADYFYDFYVPMAGFNGGITASTPLRMTGVTVTSAKSGIYGVASDLGGVDDQKYSGNVTGAWKDAVTSAPSSTPTGIQTGGFAPVKASTPSIVGPVKTGATLINGFSKEAAGSVITVYRNSTSIGTTTVNADGSWTLNGITGSLLQLNDAVTATVKPTDKSLSDVSAAVIVSQGNCFAQAPKITSAIGGGKGFNYSTSIPGVQVINVYKDGTLIATISVTAPNDAATTPYAQAYQPAQQGNSFAAGTYTITSTPSGKCETNYSNQFCFVANNNNTVGASPVITTSELTLSTTSIAGTFASAGTVTLYKNGTAVSGKTATTTTTVTTWSISLSGVSLAIGDVLTVVATSSAQCVPGSSNALAVQEISAAPVITGTYCGATTTVTGTSTEAAGTVITVFVGATQVGTTTVNAMGTWTASITSSASGTLTARAKAPGKASGSASAGVTINPLFAASTLAITTAVVEGATTISGTAPANAYITLYINGEVYVNQSGTVVTTLANGSGNWTIDNISPFELYAGAALKITAKSSLSAACESAFSAAVTVACLPANTAITATFAAPKICPGTAATIKLSSSENGVIYNIYRKLTDGTFETFGSSVLGNGKAISLTSLPIAAAGTILLVKTIKVGAPCQYTIGGELTVELYPTVPKNFVVTAVPETSSCANVSVTITLNSAETGYSYQLINNDTRESIGSLIVPTAAQNGQNIVFVPVTVSKTTTFGIVIKGVDSGCTAENTILKTITISGGPDVTRSVTASNSIVCVGSSAVISVATQSGFTYKLYQQGNTTPLATFGGTGATVATTVTSPFTSLGTKVFYATVTGGGCTDLQLTTTATVNVTDGTGFSVSAGTARTLCGSNSVQLQGSSPDPGTGQWTVKSKPLTAPSPTFSNSTSKNAIVSGLVSGTYEFTWTVTSSCNGAVNSATVKVEVNCPAQFSVKSTKFVSEYVNGDVLVTMSDVDGGISSASVTSGSIPAGTTFRTATGALEVTDKTLLVAGNYNYMARTVDGYGNVSTSSIGLRMYDSSRTPAPLPFPVELSSFTAQASNRKVYLKWTTASEQDNDRFEVERSTNAIVFETVGTVKGNGTTSQAKHYAFTDASMPSGTLYYRLKQVNLDGSFSYSNTIAVTVTDASTITAQAYPNPFKASFTVSLVASQKETAQAILFDLKGREVYSQSVTLANGYNELHISPPAALRKGLYIMRIQGESTSTVIKLIKE